MSSLPSVSRATTLQTVSAQSKSSGYGPVEAAADLQSSSSKEVMCSGNPVVPRVENNCSEECDHGELPEGQQHLEPRACFVQKPPSARLRSISSIQSSDIDALGAGMPQKRCSCVLSPSGTFRNGWDMVGVLCIVWDILMIPLQMFDLSPESQAALDWVSRLEMVFWAADMMLSFQTGFVDHGILIMDLPKIRRHYLSHWFSADLTILIADILLEFAFVESLGQMKAAKFLRLIRLLRIIRLGKLTHVSIFLRDQLQSRTACIQLNLCIVMLCIVLLEHILTCCLYGIGSLSTASSWVEAHGIRNEPVSVKYATSMRWSLAQLGFGGTVIEAVSYVESIYTVVVAFVSLMSSSTVISSMTSLISSLNGAKVEETDQFWFSGSFCEKTIEGSLGERVTGFLQYAYHTHAVQMADRPHILRMLSKPLQGDLNFHLYKGSMLKISFLAEVAGSIAVHSDSAFHKLASEAIAVFDTGDADVIFSTYQEADAAYFPLQARPQKVHVPSGRKVHEQNSMSRFMRQACCVCTQG